MLTFISNNHSFVQTIQKIKKKKNEVMIKNSIILQ